MDEEPNIEMLVKVILSSVSSLVERYKMSPAHFRQISDQEADTARHCLSALLEGRLQLQDFINEQVVKDPRGDAAFFRDTWAAQSRIFVIDYIPMLQDLIVKHYKRKDVISLLDVGAGTGAGTSLLAELFASHALWCKIEVSGIDLQPDRVIYARNNYRPFEYLVGDIFTHDRRYTIVTCSHVIEHVPEPQPFLSRLVSMAKDFVIVYAPYNEQERIAAHCNTITEETFAPFEVVETKRMKSMGWRIARPDSECILAVLRGSGS